MAEFYQGSALRIKIGTKTILHETDCSLDLKRDMKNIGSKDVDGELVIPGKKSFSLSGSAIATKGDGSQEELDTILAAYDAGTEIDISLADGITGHIVISGKAFFENVKLQAPDEEVVKYDFSIIGNGAASIGTTS